MDNQITLFIEPIDVGKWKLFQEYYEPFNVMVDYGVFAVKNGAVSLHFDSQGILQTIQRADILYSKRHQG